MKIGNMIGCKTKLTGYVFRYSWANIAKSLGYSKDMIAEALGHQYGSKVTGIYLESYDKELIDDMNHVIHLTVTMPKITPTE
jgi:integrase